MKTLDVTFVFESKKRTKREKKFHTLEDLEQTLDLALEWEGGAEGRKAYAYCPGKFKTTRVYGLIENWLPKERELQSMLSHMGD